MEQGSTKNTLIYTDEDNLDDRVMAWGDDPKTRCPAKPAYARDDDGMGCAKSLSIPGKVSGHCLGLGLDPTEVSRNSSCLCSSLSLHGCISSELQLKPDCLPYFSFSYPLDSQREPKVLSPDDSDVSKMEVSTPLINELSTPTQLS